MAKLKLPSLRALLSRVSPAEADTAHATEHRYATYHLRRMPPFRRYMDVPSMMRDPRLALALMAIRGAIVSLTRFYVDEGLEEGANPSPVKEFVLKQITRWWRTSAVKMMRSMEFGYIGAEVMYRQTEQGWLGFDSLIMFQPRYVYPVTLNGELVGIELRQHDGPHKTFIGGMKSFWHTYLRENNTWWGDSIFRKAYHPFLDLNSEGGAADVRRLYFYKLVLQGDDFYYPPGSTPGTTTGQMIPNVEIMREQVEKMRSGGNLFFPGTRDENGELMWFRQPVQQAAAAGEIMQNVADLRREMTEGMGVPEEVFMAAATGSGFSGRSIPEAVFRGNLLQYVYWMVNDFDEQICRPLVRRNFGIEPDYEIVPFGIVREEDDEAVQTPPQYGGNGVPQEASERAKQNLVA